MDFGYEGDVEMGLATLTEYGIDGSCEVHGGTSAGFAKLEALVAALLQDFRTRVACEESRGGFFEFVMLASPRYVSMLETLRGEHEQIIRSLVALRIKIRRADESVWVELLSETDAAIAAIDQHEELEYAVLIDALEGG